VLPPPDPGAARATATAVVPPAAAGLSVEIEGPERVPLNKRTYFRFANGPQVITLTWSVDGFPFSQDNVIGNVGPRHEVWIEPTDAGRVGEVFTVAAVVNDAQGRSARVTRRFTLVRD
jgi:hypothetical protein